MTHISVTMKVLLEHGHAHLFRLPEESRTTLTGTYGLKSLSQLLWGPSQKCSIVPDLACSDQMQISMSLDIERHPSTYRLSAYVIVPSHASGLKNTATACQSKLFQSKFQRIRILKKPSLFHFNSVFQVCMLRYVKQERNLGTKISNTYFK